MRICIWFFLLKTCKCVDVKLTKHIASSQNISLRCIINSPYSTICEKLNKIFEFSRPDYFDFRAVLFCCSPPQIIIIPVPGYNHRINICILRQWQGLLNILTSWQLVTSDITRNLRIELSTCQMSVVEISCWDVHV